MPDICNIRTMTVPALKFPPKRMEAHDFVSKNQRLEKVHCEILQADILVRGNMIRQIAPSTSPRPHTFATLSPFVAVYTGLPTPFRAVLLPRLNPDDGNQNNIRSVPGTPLDSGRFRQAP
jgi:hypothetical protein